MSYVTWLFVRDQLPTSAIRDAVRAFRRRCPGVMSAAHSVEYRRAVAPVGIGGCSRRSPLGLHRGGSTYRGGRGFDLTNSLGQWGLAATMMARQQTTDNRREKPISASSGKIALKTSRTSRASISVLGRNRHTRHLILAASAQQERPNLNQMPLTLSSLPQVDRRACSQPLLADPSLPILLLADNQLCHHMMAANMRRSSK